MLSHPEQLDRLRSACPEAAGTAEVAGDPCYDRMLAARPYRERHRRALGVGPDQRLVLLNSTWNPESLFGDGGDGEGGDVLPSLLPRLTAELPADEYRVAAVLHPNIWHGHGPGQVRAWLDRAARAGLTLIDPLEGWRQALLGADLVLGDHGSVTCYAAALGVPVLLGAGPLAGLDPDSPVASFVRSAPRLRAGRRLLPQVEAALRGSRDEAGLRVEEAVTSVPGEAAARLRRGFYRLAGLAEPPGPPLLEPLPLAPYEPPRRTAPLRVLARLLGGSPPEVAVRRYADPPREPRGEGAAHTAVSEETADPSRLELADVILRSGGAEDPRLGPPDAWTAEVLERHPQCAVAAYIAEQGRWTAVRCRSGEVLRLTWGEGVPAAGAEDAAAAVSALYAWLASGKSAAGLEGSLTVRAGAVLRRVRVHLR
ncbi:hypothetical protein [Streptomyces sp. ODS28]|uniref:hypothetical protein n=1 Tax=Streptomyces sp. ODS28 TaxID=3136688 RepID=UPI0031ED3AD1